MQEAPARTFDSTDAPAKSVELPLGILIDARKLRDGGIGVYLHNLIAGLVKLNDSNRANTRIGVVAPWRSLEGVEWVNKVEVIEDSTKLYSLSEYFLLARKLPLSRYSVFHAPHFTLPFGLSIAAVVTIHDLIHVHYPERFYYPAMAKTLIRSALRRAEKVICVSEATSRDVRKLIRNDAAVLEKLSIVPNSVRPTLLQCAREEKDQLSLPADAAASPFLLSVLSMHKPHKGAADLLSCHRSLVKRGYAVNLVLVGQGCEDLRRDQRFSASVGPENRVYCLGRVSDRKLAALYLAAKGVVVPSLIEGFCIPALEAVTLGVPVVCRPIAALGEIVTESDIICRDMSVAALESGIEQLLLRAEHAQPGGKQGRGAAANHKDARAAFSYVETAFLTAQLYQRAYESRARS